MPKRYRHSCITPSSSALNHAVSWSAHVVSTVVSAALALSCALALLMLAGCAGNDAQEASQQAADEALPTPFIQARYGSADATNAIVLDGTIELLTVESADAAAGDSAQEATSDDDANANEGTPAESQTSSYYVLKLDRPTTFSLLYSSAGLYESQATTDTVLLYVGSHTDRPAAEGSAAGDQLWGPLVGTHLSVRGDLWVQDDDVAGLEYPLAADAGRLAQQIGVAPNLLGMKGAEEYQKTGYSWTQLSTIARAMSATQNRTYGFRIANAYQLLTGGNDVKTLNMDDYSCTMRLVDVMADVADDGSGGTRYVGMTFICADTPYEYAFDVPAEGVTRVSWSDSQLAHWLDSEVFAHLPKKLQKRITPVNKMCTVVDGAPMVPTLETSVHSLWVPSVAELGGAPDWYYYDAYLGADDRAATNEVLAQEESKSQDSTYAKKYLYYYRNGVSSDDAENEALTQTDPLTAEPYSWWTRTVDPNGRPHYVYADGSLQYSNVSVDMPLRVVFGFCLG